MGFRFSGNTAGNKGHKRDGRTEALSNKTAWRSSEVKPDCPESQLCLVLSCLCPRPHSTRHPESLTWLHNCSHITSVSACGQSLWSLVRPYLTGGGGFEQKVNKANPSTTDVPISSAACFKLIGSMTASPVTALSPVLRLLLVSFSVT